jgi:branched-chain amino acid transport system permease protein
MTELLTAVSIGAGNGSVYALLALGFVIIYKAMSVISFAQPAFMLSGAVLVSHLSPRMGFVAAVVVGTIAIAVVALVVERVAVRPMVGKAVFVIAIITIISAYQSFTIRRWWSPLLFLIINFIIYSSSHRSILVFRRNNR